MNSTHSSKIYDGYPPTWCPGCGNYGILAALKTALAELKIDKEAIAVVYGIGCSGNMNDFLWANSFHSLHGRSIPTAIGIKIANHKLPVVAVVGDGDCYGEGGNHLIHAARGNHDITVIVHDNRVYGLTTGQASPTAFSNYKAKSTPAGVIEIPLNPLTLALTQGATFIAQGFTVEIEHLANLIKKAIKHKGFALINVFQPCTSFNRMNTYNWYRERIYKLDKNNHDPSDFRKAFEKSLEAAEKKLPIGVIYEVKRSTYTDCLPQLKSKILVDAKLQTNLSDFISEFI